MILTPKFRNIIKAMRCKNQIGEMRINKPNISDVSISFFT